MKVLVRIWFREGESTFHLSMWTFILHCAVVTLGITNSATTATVSRSFLTDFDKMDKFTTKSQSKKQRMTIPHFLRTFNGNSVSLSSAFILPVKHRIISQTSNAPNKQLHHPPARNSLPLYKVKQGVNGGLQNGYIAQHPLVHQRGRNDNNTTNTNKVFEMVGPPLALNTQLKGLFHSPKGRVVASASNFSGKANKHSPLTNYSNKGFILAKQLKDTSALREKTPLDEEIIVMGAPLIFTKGNKKFLTISKHTKGKTSNILRNRAAPFHQKAYTPQKLQGVHESKTSLNMLALHNKTTLRNDKDVSSSMSPKNIQNHIPSNGNFHKQENNKVANLLKQNQSKTSSQSESQKETFGNETVVITDNFLPHNVSLKHPDSTYFHKQTPNKSGNQLQSIEQKQTDVFFETELGSNETSKAEGPGKNTTGYQEYNAKENHGSEETNSIFTTIIGDRQENLPPFPEENSEEKNVEDLQIFSDDSGSVSKDRDEGERDGQFQGKPMTSASNQRYMPVDDFGSPFYGNETDEYFKRDALAAHNRYRALHNAPPLQLSRELSAEAEKFAKRLAKVGVAYHEINRNLRKEDEGDNVARGCSEWGGLTSTGAIHRWYSQVCYFNWSKNAIQPEAKNFMQLIWKGTNHMGIGRAFGTRRGLPCTFIVARYRPGVMNAYEMHSNVDSGSFLPSYCDADKDKGLMSTGYPSTFFQKGVAQQFNEPPPDPQSFSNFQNNADPLTSVTFYPLGPWEKTIDSQDESDFTRVQPDEKKLYSLSPRVNVADATLDDDMDDEDNVSITGDDDDWKRTYKSPKVKGHIVVDAKKSTIKKTEKRLKKAG
ncbi:uncharacterized protein LOC111330987 [Stylophora pistillata]|uniref:Golgi-associated plant pathogenesis-related protein 1 n=1 Tax=Stylophora pistillata TaxID=50429 RepID=A0A2B4S6F4_STYPI|nr:uncharacterized protein LOC111330987 [Stylophora pistillata]XP_022791737.1 uncharacterized protein LOC111330987 [Stylophora pistillata]PFX24966.1 Golgi-associated plant pathogenesis-related protein 1 [Stylophora pistillata]